MPVSGDIFKQIFENAGEGIVLLDILGNVMDVNPKMLQLSGLGREEIVGKNLAQILPRLKVDLPPLLAEFKNFVSGKPYRISEWTITNKQGRTFTLLAHGTLLKDKEGKLSGVLSMLTDITEQKEADRSLREREQRYKILFEYAPDAYYLSDLKGTFVDGNKAAEKITGYDRKELLGKSFLKLKLLPADQIPKAAALLAKNSLGHPTGPDEFTLLRKDGQKFEVEISTYPIRIEGRSLVLGIARDITARKQATKALRESESRYRSLIEDSPDAIITLNTMGTVTSCNPAYTKMTGYSREEMVGKHISRVPAFKGQDVAEYLKIFGQIIAGQGLKTYEFKGVNKDGTLHYGEAHIQMTREGEKITGFQAVIRDISERRRAEEGLRKHAAELEKMNKFMVGRELDMLNLKKEVNALLKELDRPERYRV